MRLLSCERYLSTFTKSSLISLSLPHDLNYVLLPPVSLLSRYCISIPIPFNPPIIYITYLRVPFDVSIDIQVYSFGHIPTYITNRKTLAVFFTPCTILFSLSLILFSFLISLLHISFSFSFSYSQA